MAGELRTIIDPLRDLLEPGADVTKDDTLQRPYEWRAGTLYAYPTGTHTFEAAGDSRTQDEQRFEITFVYVQDSSGEEARLTRYRSVGVGLDDKAIAYTRIVRENRRSATWSHIEVASVDWDFLNNFNARGFALVVRGWRYVS